MAHDVFISYSTGDQKVAEKLSAYLERNGIRCFIAYRDIPKGIDWAEAVTIAIENCRLMIIVFSERFNRSKHVDREITLCIEERKPISTFKIQNVPFTGTKKYYLQNLNWIDAFPHPEKRFEALCSNIRQLIPELCLQKEQEEQEEKERKAELKRQAELERKEELKRKAKQKAKTKKRPKHLYYLLCGAAVIIILLTWLFIATDKPVNNSDDVLLLENDTTTSEPLPPIIISDTSAINVNSDDADSKTNNPAPALTAPEIHKENTGIKTPKETENQKPKDNAEYVEITFTVSTTLNSTSGEQFTAVEGDTFKGKMKNGKVVQGNVIRDDQIVKSFFEKRNQ